MNNKSFTVVASGRWPTGREKSAGWIRLQPGDLERRAGVVFQHGRDDLDELWEAGLQLASGRPVLLVSRPTPEYGIDVYVDDSDDSSSAMTELASALELAGPEISTF